MSEASFSTIPPRPHRPEPSIALPVGIAIAACVGIGLFQGLKATTLIAAANSSAEGIGYGLGYTFPACLLMAAVVWALLYFPFLRGRRYPDGGKYLGILFGTALAAWLLATVGLGLIRQNASIDEARLKAVMQEVYADALAGRTIDPAPRNPGRLGIVEGLFRRYLRATTDDAVPMTPRGRL